MLKNGQTLWNKELSQTNKMKMIYSYYSSQKRKFFGSVLRVSPMSVFPALSVILTLLYGCVIEKIMLSIKEKKKTSLFIITLVQTLTSTKKAVVHSEPCKTSKEELIRRFGKFAGSLGWGCLVFVTVNQVKVFSRNITHSVTGFNPWDVQHFKWPITLKLSHGPQIKHCYWTHTKAKQ